MEFGKVSVDDLKLIDFAIPKDNPLTTKVLKAAEKNDEFSVHIGCAKWGRKEWVGNLYPKGAKDADFLKYYSKQFNSVEVNATFYQNFPAETIKNWYHSTPDHFSFSPKFPQSITHISRLKNAEEKTDKFFVGISELKEKLGHLLLQLPDNFAPKSQEQLLAYLKEVHRTFPIAVELRNTNWFNGDALSKETFQAFHEMGVAAVITDAAGRRDCLHQTLTTPVAFIRFVANDLDPTDYQRLDLWVEKIAQWKEVGLQRLYFYVHNEQELYSPKLCSYLIDKLNAATGLQIQAPIFNDTQQELF